MAASPSDRGASNEAGPEGAKELTALVARARSGLRSEVSNLLEGLSKGELMVPLAEDIPELPKGERVQLEQSVNIAPYLLHHPEGGSYLPLFSEVELLAPIAQGATDEFDYCTMPGLEALRLALDVLDSSEVEGLVMNPGHDSELVLQRAEVASLVNGEPVPLVGYVRELSSADEAGTLVADSRAAPPGFAEKVRAALADVPEVLGHRLEFCFNRERDLEPHWVLRVMVNEAVPLEQGRLAQSVFASVEGDVPPPGYFDLVFDRVPG